VFLEITCGSNEYNFTVQPSDNLLIRDKHGFFYISIDEFCISMSPSRTILPSCQNEFTLQESLPLSLTVYSYAVKRGCCDALKPPEGEWSHVRLCTNVNIPNRLESDSIRYYQCVESSTLPIQIYYDSDTLVS